MNKNTLRVAIVLTVLAAVSAAPAAGPFEIRRAPSPAELDSAPPVATVVSAPFDEAAGLLDDGRDWYWAVYDGVGSAVPVSIVRVPSSRTVRLGFDDGVLGSAPVDAASSTIAVAPSSVPADGVAFATVTVVPRDAAGVPLGTGLTVALSATALWPGRLSGALEDRGDGSYVARVVASVPGMGSVRVTVEGVVLGASPSLTFVPLEGLTRRDVAVQALEDLLAPGGRFDQLLAGLDPLSDPSAAAAYAARDAAILALQRLHANLDEQDAHAARADLKDIVDALVAAIAAPGAVDDPEAAALAQDLLDIIRLLAEYWIDVAEQGCGTTAVAPARLTLAEGDVARYDESNLSKAANRYARAIETAISAC